MIGAAGARLAGLFYRLRASHRHHQAQHQHRMNEMHLAGVRRELAALDEMRKELEAEKIATLIDLDESEARVKRTGHAHRAAQCA